jgi:hypothetical protein
MGRGPGVVRSLALAIVALTCFVQQTDTSAARGEALFERAVRAAESGSYPNYASYAVTVSFADGASRLVDTWNTCEDIAHGSVYADIFSQQERSAPTRPRGFNLVAGLSLQAAAPASIGANGEPSTALAVQSHALNPQVTGDPIGPVAFAVDQLFGLTPPRTYRVMHDGDTFSTTANGLAVIGHTGERLARYRVELVDADATTDHLSLTPLRDPYHNRLRELWIDATTALARRAVVAGIGDRAPLDRVPWSVDFVQTQGGTYVADERALEPIDFGGSGRVADMHVQFDDLVLTSTFPSKLGFGIATPVRTLHDP